MGWYDVFEDMVESYSCGGSPYWAAKAFSPLLLSLDDPFWTDPEEMLPAESGDEVVAFESPGLIVRTVGGESEIINVGSQIASCNIRFGTWKWGKLSYRSSIGFLMSHTADHYPLDVGLTATNKEQSLVLGRHYTAPIKAKKDGMTCLYSLGHKSEQSQISVETHMWWKAGWQLILHRYIAHQNCLLRHGSYALPVENPGDLSENKLDASYVSVFSSGTGIALQNLGGYNANAAYDRLSESDGPRVHIQSPFHALRTLEKEVESESGYLACLSWAGSDQSESIAWKIISLASGRWELEHCTLGCWVIADESLPDLS